METTFVMVLTSHKDMIYIKVLQFLEGHHLVGPSLEIFKLALLNRKMHNFIKSVYEIDNFIEFANLHSKQSVLDLLTKEADLSKYTQNRRFLTNLEGAWANEVFGNSVFLPIKGANTGLGGTMEKRPDGKKIAKANNLRKQIYDIPMDHKSGGGFYVLRNVKTTSNTFLDIFILIDGGISDKKSLRLLKDWNSRSLKAGKFIPDMKDPDELLGKGPK